MFVGFWAVSQHIFYFLKINHLLEMSGNKKAGRLFLLLGGNYFPY